MEYKMRVGYFTMQPSGHESYEYWFKVAEGEYIELNFPNGVDQAVEVPTNENIALCMSVSPVDGKFQICTEGELFRRLSHD